MKRLLTYITLFLFLTMTWGSASAVQYSDSAEALKDLKVFTQSDSKKDDEHLANILVKVHDAVEFCLQHKASPELLKEIIRVANLTIKNDPTLAAADVLAPLYRQDEKAFKKALEVLPKADSKALLKAILDSIHEETEGNG